MYDPVEVREMNPPEEARGNDVIRISDQKRPCKKDAKAARKEGIRTCQAYMYVDLFPTLRMKRDIQQARKNLRKVGLSSSAESVIECKTGNSKHAKKTLCKADSISHESVLVSSKEVVSHGSRERFKNTLTKWMQHIGKSSPKQEKQRSEVRAEDLSHSYHCLNDDVDSVTMDTDEAHEYDNLKRWSPFTRTGYSKSYGQLKTTHESDSTDDLRYDKLFNTRYKGGRPVAKDRPIRGANGMIIVPGP